MPTENRSSNTEMVSVPPYVGREPLVGRYYPAQCRRCGWVGSSEELTEDDAQCTRDVGDRLCLGDCDELDRNDLLNIIQAMAAPQPHPEAIAWMVGTAFWWTKEEAERDAAAMGLPVVTLGPCAGLGDHDRLRTELVESDLAFVRAATEAEQLRAQLAERDALLRELLADDVPLRLAAKIETALSASAEPSVPGKQGAPLGAVRAPEIQDLLDRAATAIGQYGDSLLGRGQREDSVDLLDLEREVRDLEQQFKGAFAQPST